MTARSFAWQWKLVFVSALSSGQLFCMEIINTRVICSLLLTRYWVFIQSLTYYSLLSCMQLIAQGAASSGLSELIVAIGRSQDPYQLSEKVVPHLEVIFKAPRIQPDRSM